MSGFASWGVWRKADYALVKVLPYIPNGGDADELAAKARVIDMCEIILKEVGRL